MRTYVHVRVVRLRPRHEPEARKIVVRVGSRLVSLRKRSHCSTQPSGVSRGRGLLGQKRMRCLLLHTAHTNRAPPPSFCPLLYRNCPSLSPAMRRPSGPVPSLPDIPSVSFLSRRFSRTLQLRLLPSFLPFFIYHLSPLSASLYHLYLWISLLSKNHILIPHIPPFS